VDALAVFRVLSKIAVGCILPYDNLLTAMGVVAPFWMLS
jgi:hypothetical protein